MNLGFYSYDVGPAQMLKAIADTAVKLGHNTVLLPPQIHEVSAEQADDTYNCDAVFLGLSSFQTQEELVLAELLNLRNIPFIIVEDTPGSSRRDKAKGDEFNVPAKAAAVIVAHPAELEKARDFGYKKAVYLGPPPHLGDAYKKLMDAKASGLRKKLNKKDKTGLSPIQPQDKIVFVPGTKDPVMDNIVLSAVVTEARAVIKPEIMVLGFKKHPGEKPESAEEENIFKMAHAVRNEILKSVSLVDIEDYSLSELISAADIIISYTAATESIIAAYARLNTIYFYNDTVRNYLKRLGLKTGEWFVAEQGGAYKIEGSSQIAGAIKTLLSPDGQKALRAEQERHFPIPETWDTAPKYINFAESLIKN